MSISHFELAVYVDQKDSIKRYEYNGEIDQIDVQKEGRDTMDNEWGFGHGSL